MMSNGEFSKKQLTKAKSVNSLSWLPLFPYECIFLCGLGTTKNVQVIPVSPSFLLSSDIQVQWAYKVHPDINSVQEQQ